MINIPTELLRTLIAVVDLRSFTKAAQSLGVTQPAVSAQIKRLQGLLESELLDKSAPGVSLTPAGEVVVNYARRLLSINDQILDLSSPKAAAQPLRIGMTGDFGAAALSRALACFRASHPDARFTFTCGSVEILQRALREGEMDVVVALLANGVLGDARYHWSEELAWVRGPMMQPGWPGCVPLVSYGDKCVFHHIGIAALNAAGLQSNLVFCGTSIAGLRAAVGAGLGVMVLPRSHIDVPDLVECDEAGLPQLPDVLCGVYLREGSGYEIRERVAQAIVESVSPRFVPDPRIGGAMPTVAAASPA